MIGSKTHWECIRYGLIAYDKECYTEGHYIRIKIYKFDYKVFLEVMQNGHTILFKELY